jgi:hypothetical protein
MGSQHRRRHFMISALRDLLVESALLRPVVGRIDARDAVVVRGKKIDCISGMLVKDS